VRTTDRALGALVAEGFLSRLAFGMVGVTLPLYASALGLSLTQLAALTTVSSVVALVLKPGMGRLADRYGLKRNLTIAIAVRSVLCLAYAVTAAPWQLYGVRAGSGLADSMRDPAVDALIAEHGGKKAVASTFAWYQTAKTAAGSVARGAALFVLYATGNRFGLVFAIAFTLSVLPLVVVALFVREPDRRTQDSVVRPAPAPAAAAPAATAPAAATSRSDVRSAKPKVLRFAGLGFLVGGSAAMLGNLFPVIATEYAGLSTAQLGTLYLVTPLLAATGPVFGWLADHVDSRLVLSVRSVANVASSLLYLVPGFNTFFAGKALDDLGKAAFSPAWGSVMAHVSKADRANRARIMSKISVGEDAADIAAPLMAALLADVWGIAALLLARGAVAVVAEVYAVLVTRSLHEKPAHQVLVPSAVLPAPAPAGPATLRVIVHGDDVVAVRSQPGPGHMESPGTTVAVTPELRALALRYGRGPVPKVLEVLESPVGPVLVRARDLRTGAAVPAARP
jgi:MFS family permease